MSEKLTAKVLITVMTYPHPSRGYQELVCTAGVTESGEWIRLYPVDYRYREQHQQFKKYQWIEVVLGPKGLATTIAKKAGVQISTRSNCWGNRSIQKTNGKIGVRSLIDCPISLATNSSACTNKTKSL